MISHYKTLTKHTHCDNIVFIEVKSMIKSVHKAIMILNILSEAGGNSVPLGVISQKAKINKSTCSHLLETLIEDGYAVKISASRGYILGPAAYCLRNFGSYKDNMVSLCRPILKYLYKNLRRYIVLAVIEGKEKYIIDYMEDGENFSQKKNIRRDDIYRTAAGRAILLNMCDSEIMSLFERLGPPRNNDWNEIKSPEDIFELKKKINKKQIITTRKLDETKLSLGYALPVYDNTGCAGALGVAVYIHIDDEKNFENEEIKIKTLLTKAATEITRRLKNL